MTYHVVTYLPTRSSPGVDIKLWARWTDLGSVPDKKNGYCSHLSPSSRMTGRHHLPRNATSSDHTGTRLGYLLHTHRVRTHCLCLPVFTTQADVTGDMNTRKEHSCQAAGLRQDSQRAGASALEGAVSRGGSRCPPVTCWQENPLQQEAGCWLSSF